MDSNLFKKMSVGGGKKIWARSVKTGCNVIVWCYVSLRI